MSNNDITRMAGANGKFDVCLQNPPYTEQQFTDMQFVEKCNKISNLMVAVHPAKRWISETKLGLENAESGHLKSIELVDAEKAFNISARWKYVGIFTYDNTKNYDKVVVTKDDNTYNIEYNDFEKRKNLIKTIDFANTLKDIINTKENLYNQLKNKYKTMVNDGHGFVYEEARLSRGKKRYGIHKDAGPSLGDERKDYYRNLLKTGKYKYCLYKGSYNHQYDEVQEWKGQDPFELFNGQILWLTNKENVKNNIKYWLECPLCDLWRRYKFSLLARDHIVSGCAYGEIPALDFEMSESSFKKYVDSLNDFTPDEIKTLKDNNIHNADKL